MSENLALEWTVRRTEGTAGAAAASGARAAPSNPSIALDSVSTFAFFFIAGVALLCGMIAAHVLEQAVLGHELDLASDWVSRAALEARPAGTSDATLAEMLDSRSDPRAWGAAAVEAAEARLQFFTRLQALPELVLAHVVAADGVVLWSTDTGATGRKAEEVAPGVTPVRDAVARMALTPLPGHAASAGPAQASRALAHSHVPLRGARGHTVAAVEIYRHPESVTRIVRWGRTMLWTVIGVLAAGVYAIVVWLGRRLAAAVRHQQQRLVEAEALCVIGEMSAAVAHGIRNPLASMRSSAELALTGDLAATRKNAMDIIRQIDRLGLWVREVLLFSRPIDAVARPIDLIARTGESLLNMDGQLDRAGIECVWVHPSDTIPPVEGDRALTAHAITSVLTNAVEAMPCGGTLQIEFACPEPRTTVALRIMDTGPGMTAEQLERVFDPCYTTKPSGMGIGMALARRIMERFGGSIALQSRPGAGTTAILSFRAAR